MNEDKNVILVSGATGKQGGAVARALLDDGRRVAAMTRSPDGDAARALAALGADVVQADLDDEASLRAALEGVWGVFAVQDSWTAGVAGEIRQGTRLAALAKEAGVEHFVYSSVGSADRSTGIPHFESKFEIEGALRGSGFPSWVILRPVFFMENFLAPQTVEAVANGSLPLGLPSDRALQIIAVDDIGAYGRVAFAEAGRLNGRAIDFAGDELTPVQMAATLSAAAGRTVEHVRVPIEELRAFSDDLATMFEWFDEVGYSADIEGNAEDLGVTPTRFAEWVTRHQW